MSKKRKKQKIETIGRINPNLIRTRVCLDNKPIVHKNEQKLQKKYWARKKSKKEEE